MRSAVGVVDQVQHIQLIDVGFRPRVQRFVALDYVHQALTKRHHSLISGSASTPRRLRVMRAI